MAKNRSQGDGLGGWVGQRMATMPSLSRKKKGERDEGEERDEVSEYRGEGYYRKGRVSGS